MILKQKLRKYDATKIILSIVSLKMFEFAPTVNFNQILINF